MRFDPGEENWGGPSKEEMAFVAPAEEKTPETKETRAPFNEMRFNGTVDEIIAQIKAVKEETGQIATSYEIREDGAVFVMFEEIRNINHSNWGYPELNKNQTS